MPIENIKGMIDAELEGRMRRYTWRKVPSQVTSSGYWFDLSMSPGNPPPKYWFDAPPLVAKAISQSQDGGLFHGADTSPKEQYLRLMTAQTSSATGLPLTFILCDYLLYYPSCDDGTTDAQNMTNTVTLPRYTDGEGVQVLAVSVAGRTGGQQFNFSYTNSQGVSGRTSRTYLQTSAAAIGTIVNSGPTAQLGANPFCGLADGDTGVRSIESVTMLGADVGLFSLILVKPLAQIIIKEAGSPYEKDFMMVEGILPKIKDDAFLSFVCLPQGSLSGIVLMGDLKVIWN